MDSSSGAWPDSSFWTICSRRCRASSKLRSAGMAGASVIAGTPEGAVRRLKRLHGPRAGPSACLSGSALLVAALRPVFVALVVDQLPAVGLQTAADHVVEVAVGEDEDVLPRLGAGDQGLGGLFGADLGLGAGLLALVVVEGVPPDAGHGAPVFGRKLEPRREVRRRQRGLDEQGVGHHLLAGGDVWPARRPPTS